MKIRIYHELNGTVCIVKVVEQGPEKGKESSMFHDLKPGSMAEVEIDAVLQHQACIKETESELQHQACIKETESESKEKAVLYGPRNFRKFLQVYAPDMRYITAEKTASKMKISVEEAEKIIAKCKESGLLENTYVAYCPHCGHCPLLGSGIKIGEDKKKLLAIKKCYVCGKNIAMEEEDIIPAYSLSKKYYENRGGII